MSRFRNISWLGTALLTVQLWGAEPPGSSTAAPPDSTVVSPTAVNDLNDLRKRIAQQEEQIKHLQQAVDEQRSLLEKAVAATGSANTNEVSTVAVANRSGDGSVPIVPAVNVARPHWNLGRAGQKLPGGEPTAISPLGIKIGNSTFTPLGFVDFTWYGRSTNVGSGIGTNFGGVPFNNAAADHISENNFSTQNSRIGFRVDSQVLGAKVLGYFEADFLGNQPGNVFVTSNADTFRMRNIFVDVQKGKLEILGGQDWSMFTPNRRGLSPIPADIFYTQNMDTNYQAGLVWSRQTQFRLVFHPNQNWNLGLSVENPQQYIGGSGGLSASAITLPSAANIAAVGSQFNNGGTNFSVPNLHPDFIIKSAYDGHVGANDKIFHVEAGALIRTFRDAFTTTNQAVYTHSSATGVSGEVNANLEVVKNVRLIANTFFGEGGGRYVFGLAPDVIVRANGTLSPIHTYSTVDGFEATVKKNTLVYAYYGGVYIGRQIALDANGRTPIGYGVPTSTVSLGQGDNRAIQEGTFGIIQTFWKSPSYGSLSLITQYSYLTRDPWAVIRNTPKSTHSSMYWIDLRYTLP